MKKTIKFTALILVIILTLCSLISCEKYGVENGTCNTRYYSFSYDEKNISLDATNLDKVYAYYFDNNEIDTKNYILIEKKNCSGEEAIASLEEEFGFSNLEYYEYPWDDNKNAYNTSFMNNEYSCKADIIILGKNKSLTILAVRSVNNTVDVEFDVTDAFGPILASIKAK